MVCAKFEGGACAKFEGGACRNIMQLGEYQHTEGAGSSGRAGKRVRVSAYNRVPTGLSLSLSLILQLRWIAHQFSARTARLKCIIL